MSKSNTEIKEPRIQSILINQIVIREELRFREKKNEDIIADYAELMSAGIKFPEIPVFEITGSNDNPDPELDGGYLLVDGFKRMEAAKMIGKKEVQCKIFEGTYKDALVYALQANAEHGERITNEDKRIKTKFMLNHPEFSRLSDNQIAKLLKIVAQPFVSKMRRELEADRKANGEIEQPKTRTVTRQGKTFELNTSKLGGKSTGRPPKTQGSGRKASEGRPTKTEIESLLPSVPELSPKQNEVLSQFLNDDDDDTSNFEIDSYSDLKLGSSYKAGNHTLHLNTLTKLKKKITSVFTLMIYADDIDVAIKDESYLMDLADNVVIVCTKGDDIPKLQNINVIPTLGTLVVVNQKPYYLSQYTTDVEYIPDIAVNTPKLYFAELLEKYTKPEDSILLVSPEYSLLSVIETHNRVGTIIYSDPEIMRRDLREWHHFYPDVKPEKLS